MDKQREDRQMNSEIDRWTDNRGTNGQRERQMDEQRNEWTERQMDRHWGPCLSQGSDRGLLRHHVSLNALPDPLHPALHTQNSWTR